MIDHEAGVVYYVWAIGFFTGERAKSVVAHGFPTYIILDNNGKGNAMRVKAAFKYVQDGPWPLHLLKASKQQSDEFERKTRPKHSQ